MFRAYGRGSHDALQDFYRKRALEFEGTPKLCLRHLGAWHHFDGVESWELGKRQEAARLGWNALGKFWTSRAPRKIKRVVFNGMVVNTSLWRRGLEDL